MIRSRAQVVPLEPLGAATEVHGTRLAGFLATG
jgi:hypothetical protein